MSKYEFTRILGTRTTQIEKGSIVLLKNSNEFQENLKFELKSKRLEPHVDIIFKIRKCIETKYESFQKRIF